MSHYSKETVDIMYSFPHGEEELEGIANRTDFDLGSHTKNQSDYNITSDKIISLFDLENIDDFSYIGKDKILEIGAGSGRLSECILSIKKTSNYTICDIPPSIFIRYKRIKNNAQFY